ncbi:MAG: MFS transporter [Acetobacteraceae bacterium]
MLLALGSMFLQQTFVSIGRVLPAVLAPVIIKDLSLDPAWVGVYFSVTAASSLMGQMGCGSFIIRYGPLRMSQVALVMLAFGMAVAAEGGMLGFALSAVIGGTGAAVSTPTSSQLLGKVSPRRLAPLIFSIKQTAVPAGLLLGGSLGPSLTHDLGWRGAMLVTAGACFAFVFMLQPLRRRFDADRDPSRAFRLSDFKTTITSVLVRRDLRSLSFACFAFNGIQQVFTAYFVVYLTHLGYSLVAAGFVFSTVVAIAVPGRILWGWLGSFYIAPRLVMAGLALGMACSVAMTGLFTEAWPVIGIGIVAGVLSATAMSWHGILLSETARLAPEGMAGSVTGGVLSFGQMGALLGPIAYSALLSGTGSYGWGWAVCSIPALLVGITLLRQGRNRPVS